MNERLSNLFRDPKRNLIYTALVSFGAGVGLGYILGNRTKRQTHTVPSFKNFLAEHFDAEELEVIRQRMEVIKEHATEEESTIEETVQKEEGAEEQILPEETQEAQEEVIELPEWDYDKEVAARKTAEIYVIHKDEFYSDEMEFDQSTLTYYSGDDILVDQEDAPIYNYTSVIGPLMFGHGSEDPHVFYVRNTKLKSEYEILYDIGLYSVDVLGLEIEDNQRVKDLKHSGPRKFRQD